MNWHTYTRLVIPVLLNFGLKQWFWLAKPKGLYHHQLNQKYVVSNVNRNIIAMSTSNLFKDVLLHYELNEKEKE